MPRSVEFWADLGSRWMLLEHYLKPYPVCRWAQPPVEAARELLHRHRFTHEDIAAVRVDTFAEAARLDTREPADTDGRSTAYLSCSPPSWCAGV